MSSTAAPVSAPVATPTPTQAPTAPAGDSAPKGTAAPVQTSEGSAAPASGSPWFKLGNKTYTTTELEAALATHSTVDQAMKALAKDKAEVSKAKEAFSSKDKSRIMAALREQGVPKDVLAELAEEVLLAEIKESEMTPEQKELAELKAEKAKWSEEQSKKAEAEKQKALEAQTAQLAEAYETQFVQAMTESGLPRTPETLSRLVSIVQDGLDAGYEVSPAEAAVLLRSRTVEANRPVYEGMTAEQLHEALGSKVVEALIKAHTAGLQAQTSKAPDKRSPAAVAKTKTASAKPRSLDDIIAAKMAAPRRG